MPPLSALLVSLVGVCLAQAPAPVPARPPTLSRGRVVATLVASGQAGELWALGGPGLRAQFKSVDALAEHLRRVQYTFGRELRVISEGLAPRGALTVYRRSATVGSYARGMTLEAGWDDDGRLAQLSAQASTQAAPTALADRETVAALRLPFDGEWNVLWGGHRYEDNPHSSVPDQRFALDLLILKGSSFQGDGTRNEQYHCWNLPVRAPGEGVVVTSVDGVADNEPNRSRGGSLYGNHVVIDHGNAEYSLLAHLRRGSVRVRTGDRVVAGDLLGQTGSSGMSTEPHLHYQLMDHADWVVANGVPAQFRDYLSGGRLQRRGAPRRGDVIAPASIEAQRGALKP
jgi:hypothetical protein